MGRHTVGILKVLIVVSTMFLFGFGVPTHTALSNQTLDELDQSFDGVEQQLVFHDAVVSVTDDSSAYDAIRAFPEYFRMGAAGPDAFPELISGQYFHHVNQGVLPTDYSTPITNIPIPAVTTNTPYESRSPRDYRSIDVAMRMLNYAVTGPYSGDPRVLSFVMGFVSHSVGDAFMHKRVNELSGDYFTLFDGMGAFGEITEEVKHTAIEELLDQVIPPELKNSNPAINSYDRFFARAPIDFLDDFYRQGEFLDRVGGPMYDWFKLQEDAMDGVIVALDPIRVLPTVDQLLREAIFDALDNVTGGVLGFGALNAAVDQVLMLLPQDELIQLASSFNVLANNAEELQAKIIAYRRNLILLSECTMRNLAQNSATVDVVDHCTTPETLARITMPGVPDLLGLFRLELEELFLGVDVEPGPPRSRSFNIRRLAKYIRSSFKLADALEIFIPIGISDSITLLRNFLEEHRNEINQAFFIVVPNLENLMIAADSAVCTSNCIVNDCVPMIGQCIDDADGFCTNFCEREILTVDINICGLDPCDPFWPFDDECLDIVGAIGIPTLCEGLDYFGNCVEELASTGIDCVGCSLECQYDAITALELLDVAGAMIAVLDGTEALWDEAKDFIAETVIEPVACGIVLGIAREQFTGLRSLATMFDFLYDNRDPSIAPDFFAVNIAFLREDFARDPAYEASVRSTASPEAQAALDTVVAGGTLDLFADPGDDGFGGGCFEFSYVPLDFTGQAQALQDLDVLHAEPGPQAQQLLAEFGEDPVRAFLPAANTVAGNKLVPLRSQIDIEDMFAAVSDRILPWDPSPVQYSAICSDLGDGSVNLFCDVVNSNDDPACFGCTDDPLPTNPTRSDLEHNLEVDSSGIHWRRSLTACASTDEKAENEKPNVLTPFALANTDDAFQTLYTKIFRCPQVSPEFADFDEEGDIDGWTVTPNGGISFDPDRKSKGSGSMRVCGQDYIALVSPKFDTTEWLEISDTLAIDVYAPVQEPLPEWWGALQLQIHVPAANLYTAWGGQIELTNNVTRGDWTTLEFQLSPEVQAAIAGDFPNAQFQFNLNVPPSEDCWGLDNLRFENDPEFRTTFHRVGSRHLDVWTNDFLSFETPGDWVSFSTDVQQNFELVEDGDASLQVEAAGYSVIHSREFNTDEIGAVGNQINVDLFVPDPQPNMWWVGQAQLLFACPSAGIYSTYLGHVELTHTFFDEFNSLLFDLPSEVRAALLGSYSGCTFDLVLNVTSGSGQFLFDKMGFVGDIIVK